LKEEYELKEGTNSDIKQIGCNGRFPLIGVGRFDLGIPNITNGPPSMGLYQPLISGNNKRLTSEEFQVYCILKKEGNQKCQCGCDEEVVDFSVNEWKAFSPKHTAKRFITYRLNLFGETRSQLVSSLERYCKR